MVAAKLASLPVGANQHRSIDLPTQAQAAGLLSVSVPSIKRAREVIEHAPPEVTRAVERGDMAVSLAAEVTKLPQAEQQAIAEALRKLGEMLQASPRAEGVKRQLAGHPCEGTHAGAPMRGHTCGGSWRPLPDWLADWPADRPQTQQRRGG